MAVGNLQAETRVVLHSITWSTFESLLADSDHRAARFTYDRGHLEIMSPSASHERLKRLLGRIVATTTDELDIPIRSGGSMTLTNRSNDRGLEPDECYYVANEPRVHGRDETDETTWIRSFRAWVKTLGH